LEQLKRPEADMAVEAEQQQHTALRVFAELPWQWAERPLGLPEVAVVLADALLVLSVEMLVEVGVAEHAPLFSDSCS